ncbi:kinase-like domain-containing protein [Hyaloraphidium curvatum]|nr:kinase-like domain-containing protein [Hyaloraphidium curvatum]
MWARLASWFAVAEGNAAELRLRGPEERAALEGFEGFDHWKKEVEWIRRMVGKLGSPIVFSHNDMQYGNVLKKKLDDSLVLVDYEYAGFNMRGYDIANHFCEWMYDYHLPRPHLMHTEWFPTPEQQRFYLSAYLRSYYRLFGAAAPDDLDGELDHLAAEVRLLELLVHVHWGLWGIMQAANRKRYDAGDEWEYDNLGYGMRRFAAYREKKGGVAEMLEGLGITDG